MAGNEREKIENLCRYIARPAVDLERLHLNQRDEVVYVLKKPYSDGTTHIVMTQLELLERRKPDGPKNLVHHQKSRSINGSSLALHGLSQPLSYQIARLARLPSLGGSTCPQASRPVLTSQPETSRSKFLRPTEHVVALDSKKRGIQ